MSPVRLLSCFVGLCVAALPLAGCTPSKATRTPGNLPSVADETGQSKCKVNASSNKPLVVEWAAADRTQVEAGARRGIVAVRYVGCEMELLPACVLPGSYGYIATSAKRENVKVISQDELYAQMPVGALKLEAKLEREGELNVEMMIVGRKDADKTDFTTADLMGQCANATHVISGLTVGAFQFYAGRGLDAGAAVELGNAGGGASTSRDRSLLSSDGDLAACTSATATDPMPPGQCAALLRVEVVPVIPVANVAPGGTLQPQGSTGAVVGTDITPTSAPSRGEVNRLLREDPELARRYKRSRSIITGGAVMTGIGGVGLIAGAVIASQGGGGEEALAAMFGVFGAATLVGVVLLATGLPLRAKVRRNAADRARGIARVRFAPAAGGLTMSF
ncbi:MAG: hypothetical protein IAG13_25130 [Deltaproteobacteria bacterium]|nr:hypothetical protein [Nannocystaceae bacterium]